MVVVELEAAAMQMRDRFGERQPQPRAGQRPAFIGMSDFGASAPIEALMPHFGFTVDNVVATARSLV